MNLLCVLVVVDLFGWCWNICDNVFVMLIVEMVVGDSVIFDVFVKGGGLENKMKFVVLNFLVLVVDWVVNMVEMLGVGWCLLGILGLGIGGSVDKVMIMVK